MEPVALQGPCSVLEDLSATLRQVRPGAMAEQSMEGRGYRALVVVEGTARGEVVLVIGVGNVRHRLAPIITLKIQRGGGLAAGGPDELAGAKRNVDLGITVLIEAAVADCVRRGAPGGGGLPQGAARNPNTTPTRRWPPR